MPRPLLRGIASLRRAAPAPAHSRVLLRASKLLHAFASGTQSVDSESKTSVPNGKARTETDATLSAAEKSSTGESSRHENKHDNGTRQEKNSPPEDDDNEHGFRIRVPWPVVLSALVVAYVGIDAAKDAWRVWRDGASAISMQQFFAEHAARPDIDRVAVIGNRDVVVHVRDSAAQLRFTVPSAEAFQRALDAFEDARGAPPISRLRVEYRDAPSILGTLALPLAVLGGWAALAALRGVIRSAAEALPAARNVFGVGKSRARLYSAEKAPRVRLSDVAGMDEARAEIREFVDYLKSPDRFARLGGRIPRGAIISGPPGTGKTLLARAVAGEAGVPFLSVSGADFVEMFVGVGPSRVRDLFAQARAQAPCIVFIDEIDAVGKARGRASGGLGGGNDEREATLNQLLVEMDGFESGPGAPPVVVLAGTNRPDVLDAALTRPGRFDRAIAIDRPDRRGREDIFRVHLRPIRIAEGDEHGEGAVSSESGPLSERLNGGGGDRKNEKLASERGDTAVGSSTEALDSSQVKITPSDSIAAVVQKNESCDSHGTETAVAGHSKNAAIVNDTTAPGHNGSGTVMRVPAFAQSLMNRAGMRRESRPEPDSARIATGAASTHSNEMGALDAAESARWAEDAFARTQVASDAAVSSVASRMAALTPGFVGADIANVCNEAALIAAREDAPAVSLAHFEAALERVVAGLRRTTRLLSARERRTVAVHEAGHAVLGWFLEHADPLLKVSIVPRGGAALGYAQYLPKEAHLWSRAELLDRLAMIMGGRAAEAVFFGPDAVTTGARDDIERATRLAYELVSSYGMSESVGPLALRVPGESDDELLRPRRHSEETARLIDAEARALVVAALGRATSLVEAHRADVEALASRLLEAEVLSREDVEAILGPRPFPVPEQS